MRTIKFLLAFLLLAIPATMFSQVRIAVAFGPPVIPVYAQPDCPGDGYIWTPGYWAYDDSVADYYWVSGTWVEAPEVGYLWTPGYWGWGDRGYFFNDGYWGLDVGFYGGINYGFGYWGGGYDGGRWNNGHYYYNTSVNNVGGDRFHNVYNENVDHGNGNNHVSFNGGKGGIESRPNSQQESAAKQNHIPAVAAQTSHAQAARANPEQRAGVNHGNPSNNSTVRSSVEENKAGSGGEVHSASSAVHPKDLPAFSRPAAANSGNAKADQKYEARQTNLINKQNADRASLQQKQDTEHQQQKANANQQKVNASQQKLEQKHQQQTQKQAQQHSQQQQALQSHQPQARPSSGGEGGGRPSNGGKAQ